MRSRLGCWLLAAGLVTLGCLAASGCAVGDSGHIPESMIPPKHAPAPKPSAPTICDSDALEEIAPAPGIRCWVWRCGFSSSLACTAAPPQPCGPLPAEAP